VVSVPAVICRKKGDLRPIAEEDFTGERWHDPLRDVFL
jgi:hypothetical protein